MFFDLRFLPICECFFKVLNNSKMKKLIFPVVLLITVFNLNGQIKLDSSFSLSGSVDMYFRSNVNNSNDASLGTTTAPGSSFANNPGFSLGMFNLKGSYDTEKYGFMADMVFGPRGVDAVFNAPAGLGMMNQLYGYYNLSDKVTVTLGSFNTYLGYEVISPTVNFNYSTSYLFSYGPFSHAGLKLAFDLGSGFSLTTALMNPTDFTLSNPTGKYNYGGQLGYAGDKGSVFLNYLGGDGYNQIDLTTGTQLTEKFYVGLNATTAIDLFSGVALYSNVAATDDLKFGARVEYFSNVGLEGILVAPDQNVLDFTLSANYTKGNFKLIPEIRIDIHSDDAIVKTVDLEGNPKTFGKNLASFVLAGVYSF
jgi:hypothetical protein